MNDFSRVILALCGVFGVLLLGCCGFLGMGIRQNKSRSTVNTERPDSFLDDMNMKYDAEKLTKQTVLAILKAPKTAQFDLQTRHDQKRYALVKGTVSSQNSFGALLTVPIEAMYYNDNGTLKTALLNFDGKSIISDKALIEKCK